MQVKEGNLMWPFDASKTKLSPRFMAGRGKVLLEISKSPLFAQEFAKRKKIQEMLLKGELKLDQNNIPSELLRMNTSYTLMKTATSNDINAPVIRETEFKNDLLVGNIAPQSSFKTEKLEYSGNTLVQRNYDEVEDSQRKTLPLSTSARSNKYPLSENSPSYGRRNGIGAKPLRKPEKSRKQYMDPPEKISAVSVKSEHNSVVEKSPGKMHMSGDKNVWVDWENSVVVHGSLEDEDLPKIATVEDNDDIHDVIVNQYIDALQHEHNNKMPRQNRKLTPNKVQQFSKLKSTTNADCSRVSPGTQPNLPKGDDRWGGSELNGMSANTGWGVADHDNRNQYDDGSSMWSAGGSQYGGASWSDAS